MPGCKAIQISLESMHFDRFTTHRMRGYVICLAQRNIDGAGQERGIRHRARTSHDPRYAQGRPPVADAR